MPVSPDIIALDRVGSVRTQHSIHRKEKITRGNPRPDDIQRGLDGIIEPIMRIPHGLRRAADGKITVEITEIAVPDASCVQHQHIAGGKWPVTWRGNDIVIAVGAGAADQIAHIIHACSKCLGLEPAEQPG